jgi:D-glycero-D-manno-heptose 1,7-bisphosphate phosphatase
MRRAIFLDRDGVVNRTEVRGGRPFAPTRIEDFEIISGVPEAVERLKSAGFMVFVVTNQPDIETGLQTAGSLAAMHDKMLAAVAVDEVFVCPHTDAANCDCRKPKPGMLLAAARKYDVALDQSWMIGDRWRDIEAGAAVGCKTVFVDRAYAEPVPRADYVVAEMPDALPMILGNN